MSSGHERTRLPSPKMLMPTWSRLIEVWYIGSQLAGGSSRVAITMIPPRLGSALLTGGAVGLAAAPVSAAGRTAGASVAAGCPDAAAAWGVATLSVGFDAGGTGRQAARTRLASV